MTEYELGKILLVLIIVLAVIGITFVLLNYFLKKYWTEKVLQTSRKLKQLNRLNANTEVDFSVKSSYQVVDSLKSKSQFDNYRFDEGILNYFQEDGEEIELLIDKIENNRFFAEDYYDEVELIKEIPLSKKVSGIPEKTYKKIEMSLFKKQVRTPVTNTKIYFKKEYTTPAGRNHYSEYQIIQYDEFETYLDKARERERNIIKKETHVKHERAVVTQSLRYKIMQRDGFKCVLCGRDASDGVKLHVDHIKPISKGGTSDMSNLRTLCEECNLGKSDRYDPFGPN